MDPPTMDSRTAASSFLADEEYGNGAYKRRPSTPPSVDNSYSHPSDFFTTPPSTSDAGTQDSVGSPGDWSTFSWLPALPGPELPLISGNGSWAWPQFVPDHDAFSAQFLPSSIDPSALCKTNPTSYIPQEAVVAPPPASQAAIVAPYSLLGPPAAIQAPVKGQPQPDDDIYNIVARVLADSRREPLDVTMQPSELVSSNALPPPPPTLPVPKPDLAIRPPLAKHIQASNSPSVGTPGDSAQDPESKTVIGTSGRPKTSHTTIERRYRTNLNARILMLRRSVPALRVLEKDENQNLLYPDDVVDERGFVDGVRAARKASKASILGKAAEYIHVLKKRELRMKHEATGLRILISSMPGGAALLADFETKWRSRYGGEEMDEVDALSDGDDGDDDCSDDDQTKSRKKAKPAPLLKEAQPSLPTETLKRKRGRPRKNDPRSLKVEAASESPPQVQPQQLIDPSGMMAHSGGAQYLLGVFLFFSLFQSSSDIPYSAMQDSTFDGHSDHHQGTVISRIQPTAGLSSWATVPSLGRHVSPHLPSLSQIFVASLLSFAIYRACRLLWRTYGFSSVGRDDLSESADVRHLLAQRRALCTKLEVSKAPVELRRWAARSFGLMSQKSTSAGEGTSDIRERLANVELQISALTSKRPSIPVLLHLYSNLPATPDSVATFALACHSLSPALARVLWARAAHPSLWKPVSAIRAAVLGMPIKEAYATYQEALEARSPASDRTPISAMDIITDTIVLKALTGLAKDVFIRTVQRCIEPGDEDVIDPLHDRDVIDGTTWLVQMASQTTTNLRDAVHVWQGVVQGRYREEYGEDTLASSLGVIPDIKAILDVMVMLKTRIPEVAESSLPLRQALAAPVFASDEQLEECRDLLIDSLCI